jgi:hypothetical protein
LFKTAFIDSPKCAAAKESLGIGCLLMRRELNNQSEDDAVSAIRANDKALSLKTFTPTPIKTNCNFRDITWFYDGIGWCCLGAGATGSHFHNIDLTVALIPEFKPRRDLRQWLTIGTNADNFIFKLQLRDRLSSLAHGESRNRNE